MRYQLRKSLALVCLFAVPALTGCSGQGLPSVNCTDPDIQCYVDGTLRSVNFVQGSLALWTNIHMAAQILILLFGIVATVMIALQGDQNKHWTRPVGIVATTLVTGLTSALVSFHVPENIDKLVDIGNRIVKSEIDFENEAEKLVAGRSPEEVQQSFKTDAAFREQLDELTTSYAKSYADKKSEFLKLYGTASRLNIQDVPPAEKGTRNGSAKPSAQ